MKFHIFTFGCQMNVHDSSWLSRALRSRGWEEVAEDEASVFVINTCSVRDKPEQKVYSQLGRLAAYAKDKPELFMAVGGCVAQQLGKKFFDRFPLVRLVFGSDGIAHAPNALVELSEDPEKRLDLLDFVDFYPEREDAWPEEITTPTTSRQAFVNIMQGCDNFCSYCIVPYVRGRQKSRDPEAILSEVQGLVAHGAREITLLGQNVNSFGMDKGGKGVSFAELLYKVAEIKGVDRLRFTTSHPKDIAPEVVQAFGELKNLCPSLHLPMQAGSDNVLKAMRRKYDMQRYLSIVAQLKEVRPDLSLTTDLIVGFPGETEEDFQQTLEMVRQVNFESSYSFKYSDRPGVAAVKMTPKVSGEDASRRLKELQALQDELTDAHLASYVGRKTDVLFDGPSPKQNEDGRSWRGRDPWGHVVNVKNLDEKDLTGKIMPVTITEAKKHSLVGAKAGDAW
ncbi:MAG: tRNA (N6-isopentenyl adenosine(37)-C2)-methylthiotransferase MiaB [Desulfovibrio sp.]